MEQLGEDTNSFDVHYCMKSPLHKKVIQLRLADGSSRRSSGNCQHISAPLNNLSGLRFQDPLCDPIPCLILR